MQRLLCLSDDVADPKPVCNATVRFDVWAHQPYTAGGPHARAKVAGDVSLGDLSVMKKLLDAASEARRIRSNGAVGFWVTEFSRDSNPSDPGGVPVQLEAQWVAEGLYGAWRSGVSLFTWFLVHEIPWSPTAKDEGQYQSSLYQPGPPIAQDTPKPALAAFRFPFVGHVVSGKISVWGRTPWSKPGKVVVEESAKSGWHRLGVVTTDGYGIFTKTFGAPTGDYVRARVLAKGGLTSPPFPLAGTTDISVNVFGKT